MRPAPLGARITWAVALAPKTPRTEILITTRLRNGEQATARGASRNSCTPRGTGCVDLYLIHRPGRNL